MGQHTNFPSRKRKRNKMSKRICTWHRTKRLQEGNHDHTYTLDFETANNEKILNTLTHVNDYPLTSENVRNNELMNLHHLDGQLPSTSEIQVFPLKNITNISKSPTILEKQHNDAKLKHMNSYVNIEETKTETEECNLEFSFISEEEYSRIAEHELEIEVDTSIPNNILSGNRIVDLQYVLEWSLKLQLTHSKICSFGQLCVVDEQRFGLVSEITFVCNICNYTTTAKTHKTQIKDNTYKLNYGAVWGTLSTGSTYSHMTEMLACMDIPAMPYSLFHKIENILGSEFKDDLWSCLEKAGEEEYNLALEKGQVVDGSVWTTVYVDGGWSHRSYGHNYNAASGVAVIIGKLTSKILFIGIRNKYCSICARAQKKDMPPREHICFKNWSSSSSAMESDIIVEGFKESLTMHKLKYLNFIADGDSSVYSSIIKKVPYGAIVQKQECKNHVIKNYGKALHKLHNDTKITSEGRKCLTNNVIKQLQHVAQRAIYVHDSVANLRKGLLNTINHVFGNHFECQDDCQEAGDIISNKILLLEEYGILYHIKAALDRVVMLAENLIGNETSNKAEMFMSLLAKYNAGKRLNLTTRGSFETRAYIAALRYNKGISWHADSWRNITGTEEGKNFKTFLKRLDAKEQSRKRQLYKNIGKTEKDTGSKKLIKKNPDINYGPSVPVSILSVETYEVESQRVLKRLQVTVEEQQEIEKATIGQWSNLKYRNERRDRLTASLFGEVIKKRESTPCHNLVNKILYDTTFCTKHMAYGKQNEAVALQIFQRQRPIVKIRQCGLTISQEYGFLGATPDAFVGENGLIEIKCLSSVHNSGKTLMEAVKTNKQLCVTLTDGKIILKRNHNYYYQVQGQLNICQKDICFFIIYVNDKEPLNIEVIRKDEDFWKNKMLPKLVSFYNDFILPEIIYKNIPKGLKARDSY